jgi:hypothetical protein
MRKPTEFEVQEFMVKEFEDKISRKLHYIG